MTEKRPLASALSPLALAIGIVVLAFPLYYTFVASSLSTADIMRPPMQLLPGDQLLANYREAIDGGVERAVGVSLERLLWNSLVVAMLIALGKIIVSFLSAFAVVFFRFPLRLFFFWLIFITLMLPVEVRIVPTYQVMVDLGLLDSYAGLTLPLMASATATLLFRQFFLTIPNELVEAARLDNAGPLRFMRDIVLPLSKTNIAALFVILFIYGWTQYLWPLLVTNDAQMNTIIVGLARMVDYTNAATRWNYVMVTAVLAIVPPVMVVVLMQRWFVKGLVEGEK
ncbi:sn-glycerol-3-phosphate ABC transporter permease UgpE [Lampropedia aestuarii]|uniref:sn-glycerol-3-phosphate transport system permease protein UgpE n=1 Tax=Lampropedia aestuarii TaxID=2562762 RepID=A0A4S5BNZ3_9BURK|nr:sn-glycerol-3-phosphate ABC transporter permease UgpE [Lampropedia aestuarii]THJ32635.1 sn-glycerol-3-phosphate ABC transporter permease UgpE [Lampropedia aestuarii]